MEFHWIWLQGQVSSPAQSAEEIDKCVGFPIVCNSLRQYLKRYSFDGEITDVETRKEIASRIKVATLQPVSTFMNSLRERLSLVERAAGRGARVADSYVNGAAYNPRVVIALVNIFRVYYNYFETRPYVSLANKHEETEYSAPGTQSIRVHGSDERVSFGKQRRLKPKKRTPAMRAGIHKVREGDVETRPPSLSKVLYQPWLFNGTPMWGKLNG